MRKQEVKLQPIAGSSNIAATSHDPRTKAMQIKYHNGSLWQYDGVPASEHNELRSAESVGSHFHKHIKTKYAGVRIG